MKTKETNVRNGMVFDGIVIHPC